MASFTLKLGSLDLSQYVRAAPGDGFDPYSQGWVEPGFVDSPFADGQALGSIDVKNREMSWPLFASGAGKTKDQLHALIQQINQEVGKIAQSGGLVVEWKDAGATNSTYYDVVYARFDPDFNFRRSEKGYAQGTLHVWVTGYGHTGTTKLVLATSAGSGVVIRSAVPSALLGDAPALAEFRVFSGSAVSRVGRIAAIAALPHGSYTPEIPGASLALSGLGFTQNVTPGSGAAGSQWLSHGFASGLMMRAGLSPATYYTGDNRVFMVARTGYTDGFCFRAFDGAGNPIGPTAMATALDWQLIDLGVIRVPQMTGPTAAININGAQHQNTVGKRGGPVTNFPFLLGPAGSGPHNVQVNELIVLPENNLSLINDDPRRLLGFDSFDLSAGAAASSALAGHLDTQGNTWAVATGGFAFKDFWVNNDGNWADHALATGIQMCGAVLGIASDAPPDIYIRANGRINSISASQILGLRKETDSTNSISARLVIQAAASGFMDIIAQTGTIVACQAFTPTSSITDYLFEFGMRGPVATFSLTAQVPSAAASSFRISGSHPLAALRGRPGMFVNSATSPVLWSLFSDFTAVSEPSQSQAPNDTYIWDGILNDIGIATGATYGGATSGAVLRSVAAKSRGRALTLSPSTPALAFLELPSDAGPANDIISAEVRVRERFFYAR